MYNSFKNNYGERMKYCAEGAGERTRMPCLDKNPTVCSSVHVPRTADGSAAAGEDGHEVEDEGAGSAAAASGGATVTGAACIIGTSEAAAAPAAEVAMGAGMSATKATPSPSTAICCCCDAAAASMAAAKAAAVAITLLEVVDGSEADEVVVAAVAPDKICHSVRGSAQSYINAL